MPNRSRSGPLIRPARVVAPTTVNGLRLSRRLRALRPLADHHVEREVLHRRVEDLLDRAVEAVDLVDEQDVALVERGEDRGEVARPLDRRPARVADVHAELARDDRREGRLAEAGRAVQQDVVGRLSPALRRLEQHVEARLDLALADVLVERARPQRRLPRRARRRRRRRSRGGSGGRPSSPASLAGSGRVWYRCSIPARRGRGRTAPSPSPARLPHYDAGNAPGPAAPNTASAPSSTSSVMTATARSRWPRLPSATGSRRSSSSRSWRRSSTAASSGRRSARTAASAGGGPRGRLDRPGHPAARRSAGAGPCVVSLTPANWSCAGSACPRSAT